MFPARATLSISRIPHSSQPIYFSTDYEPTFALDFFENQGLIGLA
jgi:hypothetical protein